jgi:hypothetical protein
LLIQTTTDASAVTDFTFSGKSPAEDAAIPASNAKMIDILCILHPCPAQECRNATP